MKKNKVLVEKDISSRKITKKFTAEVAQAILDELNLEGVEISILLTDDETIKQLNSQWRGKDKPTDVLSFPINEKPPGYRWTVLGDVVISVPFAERQAQQIGFTLKEEFLRLLTHGILHLLGYDHETSEEDAKVMFELQDRIFEKVKTSLKL